MTEPGKPTFIQQEGETDVLTALRESEARLRAAIDASESGTFHWNIRTNVLIWDDALDRLFGLPPGETARSLENFIAMVHTNDRALVIAACEACAATGVDFSGEFRVVRPNGEVRWLYDRGKTSLGPDGRPSMMTGACVDVTDRRLASAALAASEKIG
ncbi:PAS domain-containing protein [Sphingomonas sp. UYEF23]|uniref:PAS domain-containing protein n=1 Tax=Sphingomonas sp. UYEF23 TaxID=1756408 RepID=UPI00339B97F1